MKIERQIFDFHGIMKFMIDRKDLVHNVRLALRRSRVVALIGSHQCGKTTLAQQL
jgi:ABC-type phosphate transport system ATPase subunit